MKERIKKEIRNTVILNIICQVISFVTSIVLIRLLSPDTFGLIAMIIPFVLFIKLFHSFGTINSIISTHNIDDYELSALLWGKLSFSVLISTLFVLSIPFIIYFFTEERLSKVVIFFAIAAIISSASEIYYGILYRGKNFLKIAKVELFAIVVSSTISILIAFQGKEIESLIIKEITFSTLILAGLIFCANWFPKFTFSIKLLKKHAEYGLKATISSIVSWAARVADDITIGRFFSATSLGLYSKGYNLLTIPNSIIINTALKIGIPMIAGETTNAAAVDKYKRILKLVFIINAPIGLILFFTCDIFVRQLFGDQWIELILLIKIFSILSIFQVLGPLDNILFQGRSKMTQLVKYSITLSIIVVLSIVFGYLMTKSIVGIAIFYAVGSLLSYLVAQRFVANTFKISQHSLVVNLRYGFLGFFLCYLILLVIEYLFQSFFSGSLRYFFIVLVPCIYCGCLAVINYREFNRTLTYLISFIDLNTKKNYV